MAGDREPFKLEFQAGTLKHLGLQMYSTLPPVLGELVANAWDADSARVDITIPEHRFSSADEIEVRDYGHGMTAEEVQEQYLRIGRDRREGNDGLTQGRASNPAIAPRRVMGRKGIGKFSPFGIAKEIEIETVRNGQTSRFIMNYDQIMADGEERREIEFERLPATGEVDTGTRVLLRDLQRYRTQTPNLATLRRSLARRFSVITNGMDVVVNRTPITPEERDLKRLLEVDADGNKYLWEFKDEPVQEGTDWKVTGWIGALKRTDEKVDGIQRGIAIMARGKLVQDPFVFDTSVGQQYALSYLVGELHAEFVDEEEDTVATSRNTLVWDTEANRAFLEWGQEKVNQIARSWAERRRIDNEKSLEESPMYQRFLRESAGVQNSRARKAADKLIRDAIKANPVGTNKDAEATVQLCLDYLKFDAFVDLAEDLASSSASNPDEIVRLFREWELVEAREMMKVTEGRIQAIERLQDLIDRDALEVPTLHNFLKEFPWVLDPRWNLIADEARFSSLLRAEFPDEDLPEIDRRIDFLCVRENRQLVVVEIKRPGKMASEKELTQIEEYTYFMRDLTERTTDPDVRADDVIGMLLVGGVVDKGMVHQKVRALESAKIYLRTYDQLLSSVRKAHADFLHRYEELGEAARKRQ